MNRQKALTTLLLFSTIVLLLFVGILATVIWKSSHPASAPSVSYDFKFGRIDSPIGENMTSKIELNQGSTLTQPDTTNTVYAIDTKNSYYPNENLVSSLTKKLSVKQSGDSTTFFLSDDSQTSLEYLSASGQIVIKFLMPDEAQQSSPIDEKKAEITAKNKLKELELWPFNDKFAVSYTYYKTSGFNLYETNSLEEASVIGINLKELINNIPVITSRSNSGEIGVLVDKDQRILEIDYTYRPINKDSNGTYPIIDMSSALTLINLKQAEVITGFETSQPTSVTFENVITAYRVGNTEQQYLQPVYVFSGSGDNGAMVTITVPMVETQYLK